MNFKKITAFAAAFMVSASMTAALPELDGISENAYTVSAASSKDDFVIKTDSEGKKYVESYTGKGGDIKIPSGVDYIGDFAFSFNHAITGITFPKSCTEVKKAAFEKCFYIKSITFEGDVKFGSSAFTGCSSLEKVTVKGSIIDCIDDYAFSFCSSLKTVKISKNSHSFRIGTSAFNGCLSLSSIKIPSKCTEIGSFAFLDCKELDSIIIPNKCTKIGTGAFSNCINLQSIKIPAKTKLESYSIGYVQLFENETDAENRKTTSFIPDGKKTWYTVKYDYDLNKDVIEEIIPKRLTATVVKGSPAEKYCKENGIKYKYAKTTKK